VIQNVYKDLQYATEYASLDWGGTYYLVRRDLPGLLQKHVPGKRALDFGCGAGRSTRLLHDLGYDPVGIDVSASMIEQAKQLHPELTFQLIEDGDFADVPEETFDLVLACFPFDNIPGSDRKASLIRGLASRLQTNGVLVNVVSSAELYAHEWASFTTSAFSENLSAKNEEIVRIVTRDFEGTPVCDDIRCDDAGYEAIYRAAGLREIERARPLGSEDDPVEWVNEMTIAPWVIWVLAKS